ncbi:MAG TPA: hypothetical protein DD979_15560, partial [Gammaproteobacteria bacterium]|nr:hypothetical protein [Gammaproteobacteria bacterium]
MCADFGLVLGRSETSQYIGKPAFSKFLYDKPGAQNVIDPSGRRGNEPLDIYLERLLCENQETRETIGTKITNPRLFYCQTTVEIDRLFPQHYEDNPSAPVPKDDLIILPFGDKPTDELLMDKEIEVSKYLRRRLIQGRDAVFIWEISPWSGATYVASSMVRSRKLSRLFDTMIVIRSNSFLAPYDHQLRDIAEILSIDCDNVNSAALPMRIAEELFTQKVFLVIADAFLIPQSGMDGGLINKLLEEVCRIHSEKKVENDDAGSPTRILLIGTNGHLSTTRIPATISSENLSVPQVYAFAEFQKFWRIFRETRDMHRYELGGPRLKRAKAMYEATEGIGKTVSPSEIRLHAFFAADITNYGYSDPTAGYTKLIRTSEDAIPFAIRVMHDDIISYLRSIWPLNDGARETKIRSLQYCSTTKHWLS